MSTQVTQSEVHESEKRLREAQHQLRDLTINIKYVVCNYWLTHVTLVLVWPRYESWWNSHANSRLSTLMHCNSCSRLTRTRELMKLSCKLSLVNCHATLVLVWPGHESWWNSHANSRLSVYPGWNKNSSRNSSGATKRRTWWKRISQRKSNRWKKRWKKRKRI